MATKKQKKRREKERRHEYEYVYVDAEGQEVEVDGAPAPSSNGTPAPKPKPVQAGGRTVQPPSWRRTFRRALLFAPFMFLVLYLLRPKDSQTTAIAFNVVVLLAFFIPFSYFMDSVMYRVALKRGAKVAAPGKKTTGAAKGSARK